MMRFTRLVCVYMSTFLLEMLYTIHACRTRVSSSAAARERARDTNSNTRAPRRAPARGRSPHEAPRAKLHTRRASLDTSLPFPAKNRRDIKADLRRSENER